MSKQKQRLSGGLVYSTDPTFKIDEEEMVERLTIEPAMQKLKIRLDKKHRAGKVVTIIDGFTGKEIDQQELGKKLKAFCGTGGSVKDGEIIVQGDNRDKLLQWLHKNGYISAQKI